MASKKYPNCQPSYLGLRRIVSGGQTGVDQAALDIAIELGIPHGGWCPKGRISEAGRIDSKYQLSEMPTPDYAARTQRNVLDSDGTLILYQHRLQGGTALTWRYAQQLDKPRLRVRIDQTIAYSEIVEWILKHKIGVLNVAGPRASSDPQLYQRTRAALLKLLRTSPGLFS
jgi:hypothetical protein